jgi:integrase
LDDSELERLAECPLPNEKFLEGIRNTFLVLCYTGLRFNDLRQLKPENIDIDKRTITVRTEKTDATVKIPITDKLLHILNRYKTFEFDIISNTHFNKHLKYVAKFAELNREVEYIRFEDGNKIIKRVPIYLIISSHCGRRTFITNALRKGINERLIMKVTGHKSTKAFAKYIKLTETEAQNAFMDAFK